MPTPDNATEQQSIETQSEAPWEQPLLRAAKYLGLLGLGWVGGIRHGVVIHAQASGPAKQLLTAPVSVGPISVGMWTGIGMMAALGIGAALAFTVKEINDAK